MSENTTGRLERETCSRCGGTGSHSYCPMYGTTCFKCRGRKFVYTKRGAAALAYLQALRSRKVSELKPGDTIKTSIGWTKIEVIREHNPETDGGRVVDGKVVQEGFTLETSKALFHGVKADATYEVMLTKEEQLATHAQAMAYQETLTKAGTPRKTRKAAGKPQAVPEVEGPKEETKAVAWAGWGW
jgi:hypothetical protein